MFAKEHNYNLTALDKIVLEWWKWQYKQALQEHYKELGRFCRTIRLCSRRCNQSH